MSLIPSFREDKVTQAASVLIERNGGVMNYMHLLKLLYLADRKAIELWERPISYDRYVSMNFGPVPSTTYDLIKNSEISENYWSRHIRKSGRYSVSIKFKPAPDSLSPAEVDVMNQIFDEFGRMDPFTISEYTHQLPEYQNPHGSSLPIAYSDILTNLGYDDHEIKRVLCELEEEAAIEIILGD